jgi:hypothetical protein
MRLNRFISKWGRVFVLAFAWPIMLAGCVAYEWRKPGMTEASLSADRDKCQVYARANYIRARGAYGPPVEKRRDEQDDRYALRYPPRSQVESRLFEKCMQKKGYRLVKKKKE